MMIMYVLFISLFAYVLSVVLPFAYQWQKKKVIESCKELMNEADDEIGYFPFLSLLVISVASLIYYLSSDFILFIFCCCLAIVAYIDACKRWIPDQMIYLLIAISVYSLGSRDLTMSLIAVSFYITPVALLSVYGYLVKRESWIASGDYYVFPSIGLMLTPDYAAGVMLTTLFAMLILTRWVRKIPLITVAYFTFTGFKVCSILGIL